MSETLTSIGLVLLFVLVGGVFAGTELALVSLRESQLDQLAKKGKRGRKVADVARDPNRFLAAVQIGVTVAGFLSAAYGATALAPSLIPVFTDWGMSEATAASLATVVLTLLVAFVSLVLGELVPKRLALQRAGPIAMIVAPALDAFARLMRPVIWLLSVSTNAVVRLLGGDPRVRSEEMSEEELRDLVGAHQGLHADERTIVRGVLGLSERTLAQVLRPRGDVTFLAADTTVEHARQEVARLPYSRYPVIQDNVDDVVGFIHLRDLMVAAPHTTMGELVREIPHMPATALVVPVLAQMRADRQHIGIVVDEYGGTDGIITLEDLLEEFVGDIADEYDPAGSLSQEWSGGDLDGALTIEEFAEATGVRVPEGPFETIGGYLMARLGRMPLMGDVVEVDQDGRTVRLKLTVVDGHRIRAVRVAAPDGSDLGEAESRR